MKEKIPDFLAPVLIGDRGTYAYRAVQRRARFLTCYPEDVAARITVMRIAGGQVNRRDANASMWLVLHQEHIDWPVSP